MNNPKENTNRKVSAVEAQLVYVNGEFVPRGQASVPVDSTGVRYGANVFEGICVYKDDDGGLNLFRWAEHYQRLLASLTVTQIELEKGEEELRVAIAETLKANDITGDAHVRLSVVVTGFGVFTTSSPTALIVVASERPDKGLNDESYTAGISSWERISDRNLPPRVKSGANYMNSRLALLEARAAGYDESILLNRNGRVAEASSACILMVKDGVVYTPPVTEGLLEGVTRSTLMEIAQTRLGLQVVERPIDRTELYIADEILTCSSFNEVRPVSAVDARVLQVAAPGPVTRNLWQAYQDVVHGRVADYKPWLMPLDTAAAANRTRETVGEARP